MSTGEVMRNYPILAHCATSSFANERSNNLHFFWLILYAILVRLVNWKEG